MSVGGIIFFTYMK